MDQASDPVPTKDPGICARSGWLQAPGRRVLLQCPVLHRLHASYPGLRHASPMRKALGVPTAINNIAPLTNPAAPSHSLVGCASKAAGPTLARVLAERGANAIVVRGDDGLDELTTTAASTLWAVTGGRIRQQTIDPS